MFYYVLFILTLTVAITGYQVICNREDLGQVFGWGLVLSLLICFLFVMITCLGLVIGAGGDGIKQYSKSLTPITTSGETFYLGFGDGDFSGLIKDGVSSTLTSFSATNSRVDDATYSNPRVEFYKFRYNNPFLEYISFHDGSGDFYKIYIPKNSVKFGINLKGGS